MSVRITTVSTELPPYSRETEEIIPFVEQWMVNQESRFQRKVIKIFEGAGVAKRYSIMDPIEVFNNPSFGERNDIYAREITILGKKRSEEHTSELQSRPHLVCRLLLEKKKKKTKR